MCSKAELFVTLITLLISYFLFFLFIFNSIDWEAESDERRVEFIFDISQFFLVTSLFILICRYFLYCSNLSSIYYTIMTLGAALCGIISYAIDFQKNNENADIFLLLFQYSMIACFAFYWLFNKYIY